MTDFARLRPHQLHAAIAANTPVVLPIGVMEYHGHHLPAGVDLLAVTEVLARLGDQIITLPPFAYGAASHAVAGPEGTGTLHIDASALLPMAEGLFTALLKAGFRNIRGVIHHQTEGFDQGMPTDLAFRLAGRNAIMRYLEATRGPGWWGDRGMQDYYARQAEGDDPFNWIRIHPLFPKGAEFPFDHAGKGETALMQALAPDTVDMARAQDGEHWYTGDANEASVELGERGVQIALTHLRQVLGLG
ncbi:MAG: creatininase family protein [Tabrizicola sp.]|uniref:creatininase family protein n=1 Tax=Tabrizicola sp. TaxID=2005166 RepID=UPI002ABA0F9B|nr:creatininase family protein [Tabrizicola sp.]MDZ4087139.1 creatininase family protein [Tabrizicola sp.]